MHELAVIQQAAKVTSLGSLVTLIVFAVILMFSRDFGTGAGFFVGNMIIFFIVGFLGRVLSTIIGTVGSTEKENYQLREGLIPQRTAIALYGQITLQILIPWILFGLTIFRVI